MAEVATSHLDPQGKYFSGFGYSYDSRYDTPSFWSGQGGALAFEMFRLDKGATEVYLQVATSRKFAVRCGATTHQKCLRFRLHGRQLVPADRFDAGGAGASRFSTAPTATR